MLSNGVNWTFLKNNKETLSLLKSKINDR
jgi:hypothetical protein